MNKNLRFILHCTTEHLKHRIVSQPVFIDARTEAQERQKSTIILKLSYKKLYQQGSLLEFLKQMVLGRKPASLTNCIVETPNDKQQR